jgi:GT2 family glycosyltransferase
VENILKEKIDIVVLTYNTPIELSMCLNSIQLYTVNCKVIIIDNGDDNIPLVDVFGQPFIKKVISGGNLGFCIGLNRGVDEVTTEKFAVLPADCMITQGWESRMTQQFNTLKNPGIVAPMCTQTSGHQGVERGGLPGVTQRVERIILNGAVMRKEDFLKVGRMDENFPNKGGNFSDDDLSRRFYEAGYTNYVLNHLIFHCMARSYGGMTEAFQEDYNKGWWYFKKKWKIPDEG